MKNLITYSFSLVFFALSCVLGYLYHNSLREIEDLSSQAAAIDAVYKSHSPYLLSVPLGVEEGNNINRLAVLPVLLPKKKAETPVGAEFGIANAMEAGGRRGDYFIIDFRADSISEGDSAKVRLTGDIWLSEDSLVSIKKDMYLAKDLNGKVHWH